MTTRLNRILILGSLLTVLGSMGSALALSGDECIAVSESGSADEIRDMTELHTVEQLFRVRDKGGRGLLHYCLKRPTEHWKILLEAGWPTKLERGWTPQHEAALLGNREALMALKNSGANLGVQEPHNGGTPLHVAAFNGHFEVVKFLVEAGVNVNPRDKEGWTPLSQARDQGFPAIADWLKKNGATR